MKTLVPGATRKGRPLMSSATPVSHTPPGFAGPSLAGPSFMPSSATLARLRRPFTRVRLGKGAPHMRLGKGAPLMCDALSRKPLAIRHFRQRSNPEPVYSLLPLGRPKPQAAIDKHCCR